MGLEVDIVPGDAVGHVGGERGAHGEQEPLLPGQVETMQRPSWEEVLKKIAKDWIGHVVDGHLHPSGVSGR